MRGLLPLVKAIGLSFGITPAHAGLTSFHILPQAYLRDHPRACGAYLLFLFGGLLRWGSPPRMRGLLTDFILQYGALGITPAHAGLTAGGFGDRGYNRDHPRACGAYLIMWHSSSVWAGSPPRMRGLLLSTLRTQFSLGITPAHAGLTTGCAFMKRRKRDHPRACGAYRTSVLLQPAKRGSPPRMRGLPVLSRSNQRRGGITPAHAGLTCGSSRYPIFFRDHPRACGAY